MSNDTYSLIERVLEELVQMPQTQPSLASLANSVGLSEFHFQRLFTDWVGISPKKFMQHLTIKAAKERLRNSASVLDASLDAGLSGPGRLHDLMVSLEAMTPGEYKQGGQGLAIRYGQHQTPFGSCTVFVTDRGICGLEFSSLDGALKAMQQRWPGAQFTADSSQTLAIVDQMFPVEPKSAHKRRPSLSLYVSGSKFQVQVWKALLTIPAGSVVAYGNIAHHLDMGKGGARAVGTAIGANPIGWLIPCHRVIRQTGVLSEYRWGKSRKLAMLGWEASARLGDLS